MPTGDSGDHFCSECTHCKMYMGLPGRWTDKQTSSNSRAGSLFFVLWIKVFSFPKTGSLHRHNNTKADSTSPLTTGVNSTGREQPAEPPL